MQELVTAANGAPKIVNGSDPLNVMQLAHKVKDRLLRATTPQRETLVVLPGGKRIRAWWIGARNSDYSYLLSREGELICKGITPSVCDTIILVDKTYLNNRLAYDGREQLRELLIKKLIS